MKKLIFLTILVVVSLAGLVYFKENLLGGRLATSQKGLPVVDAPLDLDSSMLADWKRPDGPPKVGIQVGHLDNEDIPEELDRIRGNTGARPVRGMSEAEVVGAIAQETKKELEKSGVVVDILPATVPERYWADVFISIHADDHTDPSKSGYKFSGPRRDITGKTNKIVDLLEKEYERATGLVKDPNITRNMRGYYAFSWWRFDHAIHPATPGVIAETGFMSNGGDSELLIETPEIPGKAIARALVNYLSGEGLL